MNWSFSNLMAHLSGNGNRHIDSMEKPMNVRLVKLDPKDLSRQLPTIFALAAITLICFSLLCWGQKPKVNPLTPNIPVAQKPEAAPSTAHPMTGSDVEAFLAGLEPLQLQRDDIAGVTIAVVKDSKVLLAKGYGCRH